MDYKSAIEYIHSFYGKGEKRGLENGYQLMRLLGNPHERLKMLHVAGTNGKGSVCALCESALRAQGYRTGLYTSPYLERFNERIRIAGEPIDDGFLAEITSRVKIAVDELHDKGICKPTEFEVGTAIALLAMEAAGVDIAVIEVGLGGRLDPTNIITPLVCAIARIGLDHTKILGETHVQIAGEKAGIIKRGVPVVVYPQERPVMAVFEERCAQTGAFYLGLDEGLIECSADAKGCDFSYGGETKLRVNLPGGHQVFNAATALGALRALRLRGVEISDEAIESGFARAKWPGRIEWMTERVLIDCAHNPQGAMSLREYAQEFLHGREIVLITGSLRSKDAAGIAAELAQIAKKAVIVPPDSHKAADTEIIEGIYEGLGVPSCRTDSVSDALEMALNLAADSALIVIAGSIYLAGEARSIIRRRLNDRAWV